MIRNRINILSVLFFLTLNACSSAIDDYKDVHIEPPPPIPKAKLFLINNNAEYLYRHTLKLDINVTDAEEMRFKENDSVNWTAWEPYNSQKEWIISNTSYTNQTIKVSAQFKNSKSDMHLELSDDICFIEKLSASDINITKYGKEFSVSKDGKTLAVSTPAQNKITIYKFNDLKWIEYPAIKGDILESTNFGKSISLSGDGKILAVGIPDAKNDAGYLTGLTYIYDISNLNTITADKKPIDIIKPNNNVLNQNFGHKVLCNFDANHIIIGAPTFNVYSGKIYIYKKNSLNNTYEYLAEAVSPANTGNEYFGSEFDIDDSFKTILVSQQSKQNEKAFVYTFDSNTAPYLSTPVEINKIPNNELNSALRYSFANNLSISGDGNHIAIAAHQYEVTDNNDQRGKVFLYSKNVINQWIHTKTISDPNLSILANFGYSLDFNYSGDLLTVSAPYNTTGTDYGHAVQYKKISGNWEMNKLHYVTDTPQTNSQFGTKIIHTDRKTFISAPNASQGTVFILSNENSSL